MSSVSKGNEFRDSIVRALVAASYRNVEAEKRLGGFKKVDIYYEEISFGSVMKVAVEAKNYERPLVKSYVMSNIYPEYKPLLETKEVDKVIIIAPHDVSPDTREYIKSCGFLFMTIHHFYSHVMDFWGYLDGLCTSYKEGGLDKYYMPLFYSGGLSLEDKVLSWLNTDGEKPIAILAGYGMGKTSFSRHIACKLAESFKSKSSGRIPIYIRLGEISDEQSLEGLLAKSLTSARAVQKYTFELFMELNRCGQFCILLDGFDEMKHTMTWDQFRHNVKELNRLIEGKSKVVLLGRPSAFVSDSEQALILRGVRPIEEKEVRAFEWSIYERIELEFFTPQASIEFIGKYIRYLIEARGAGTGVSNEDFVRDRLDEISGLDFSEILLRPVQAKMLAEIASDPSHKLKSYSRYGLYKHFMDCIIERELSKPSRHSFSSEVRRGFVRDLAWWMWGSGNPSGVSASEIPSWIVDKCKEGRVMDKVAVLRDLISGSVLETKLADKFYFPHRSYQEFLVSEYIINLSPSVAVIDKIRASVNKEIIDFVRESGEKDGLLGIYDLLPDYQGGLNVHFLELMIWASSGSDRNEVTCEWHLIIKFLSLLPKDGVGNEEEAARFALEMLAEHSSRAMTLTSLLCMCLSIFYSEREDVRSQMMVALSGAVLRLAMPEIDKIISAKKNVRIALSSGLSSSWLGIVLNGFDSEGGGSGDVRFSINVKGVFDSICDCLAGRLRIFGFDDFPEAAGSYSISNLAAFDDFLSMTSKGGSLVRYFKDYHNLEKMVPVTNKKTKEKKLPSWVNSSE
ncbi:NACHT domain-containing protein [Ectopseudomonas mendocina]|uniref:NACHT domain-containing protein n=1 Tax=Ectopseudomonas mendocina TaxID=300 RepID=UPI003132EFAF